MRSCSLTLLMLLLVPAAALADGNRCTGEKVAKVMNRSVAVYDAHGGYIKDIDGKLVKVGESVLDCTESPAHVLVKLTQGPPVWVDRLDLGFSGGAAPPPRHCKPTGVSKPRDQTTPATSGIDSCSG